MWHDKGIGEENEGIWCTHNIYKIRNTLIPNSVTDHMVIAGIYNCILLLPILCSLCLQQAPQLAVSLCLME